MKTIDAKTKDLKALNTALRQSVNGTPIKVKNAANIHGLAAGMKHGEIIVESNVGDYFGVLNAGAIIHAAKDAGKYLADNMTSGTVLVDGSAAYGAGQYCYGGVVVIRER